MLTTHLHLVPRLRMSGDVTLLPFYAFMAWTGTISTYFLLYKGFHEKLTVSTTNYCQHYQFSLPRSQSKFLCLLHYLLNNLLCLLHYLLNNLLCLLHYLLNNLLCLLHYLLNNLLCLLHYLLNNLLCRLHYLLNNLLCLLHYLLNNLLCLLHYLLNNSLKSDTRH
jgi:hypothetical protein